MRRPAAWQQTTVDRLRGLAAYMQAPLVGRVRVADDTWATSQPATGPEHCSAPLHSTVDRHTRRLALEWNRNSPATVQTWDIISTTLKLDDCVFFIEPQGSRQWWKISPQQWKTAGLAPKPHFDLTMWHKDHTGQGIRPLEPLIHKAEDTGLNGHFIPTVPSLSTEMRRFEEH